jgi:hypothetical protein
MLLKKTERLKEAKNPIQLLEKFIQIKKQPIKMSRLKKALATKTQLKCDAVQYAYI